MNYLIQHSKKKSRELAMKDGYYDGRFRPRVVKDKKKEASRKACRTKTYA